MLTDRVGCGLLRSRYSNRGVTPPHVAAQSCCRTGRGPWTVEMGIARAKGQGESEVYAAWVVL
jgi:hypothetical protein